ncbi:MAG: EAL domain-containing protein [Pseudomonadota bacterium]
MQPRTRIATMLRGWRLERPIPQDVASLLIKSRSAVVLSLINAALVATVVSDGLGQTTMALWLGGSALIFAVVGAFAYRAGPPKVPRITPRVLRGLHVGAIAMALPWGVLCILALSLGGPAEQVVAMVVCAGTMAGSALVLLRVIRVAATFYLAMLLPCAAACLAANADHLWPIPVSLSLFGVYLLAAANTAGTKARERDISAADARRTVVELETAYETISKLAFFDITTDLPNRKGFVQRMDDLMEGGEDARPAFALFMLDLDRFKNVNDTLGHHVGDRLLAIVAERLRSQIDDDDMLARLGGDEFAVLVTSAHTPEALEALALKLVTCLNSPATIGSHEVYPGTSIGGARYPDDAGDSGDLMKHADIALHRAKESGRGCFVLFDESIRGEIARRDWIESELKTALASGQLRVAYQPKYDLLTGEVLGAEALVRWTHPLEGPIEPGEFLSVAAERGLIYRVTCSIVTEIARDLAAWRREGVDIGKIAMNLHPLDLKSPTDLLASLDSFAADGLDPRALILEVTEGCIVGRGMDCTPMLLDELSERGFEISLDDFGTGYASLSHLFKMPIREIKVDRSFIRGLTRSTTDRAVVSATVEIARELDLQVVAEGVETIEQVEALRALGVHSAQGFFWSGPISPREFEHIARIGTALEPSRSAKAG